MHECPSCGADLPEGMTCRDLFLHMMEQEYRVMALRRDYLAARKLTNLNYMLQHSHGYNRKELTLASRMLTLVVRDGYFPLDAGEILGDQYAHSLAFDQPFLLNDSILCSLNIGNFRNYDEPYLDSAYRWSRSVFDCLVCPQHKIANPC